MRIVFLIIVLFHGLIHLFGFVKGFELKEVKNVTLPISKPMGVVWLTATILFLIYGILYLLNSKYAWLIGIVAVVFSQALIFLFWKDAKFGTIPNAIILAVSIVLFGYYNFQKRFQKETEQLLYNNINKENRTLNESDLTTLPEPVIKWLRNSGALGNPFINYGKVVQIAKMQMKPGQDNWLTATAIQYTAIDNPAFIWSVDLKMNSLLNFQGRDKYEDGKGEMVIKMNSLINVVNAQGKKLDEGTLQRFLGEMVWFPSLALSPYITWEEINDTTAKATMSYKGTKGSGNFFFNEVGDFVKFSAMRFKDVEPDAKRYEWILTVDEYRIFESIKIPSKMKATWKLEEGDWTWLDLQIIDLKYNEGIR